MVNLYINEQNIILLSVGIISISRGNYDGRSYTFLRMLIVLNAHNDNVINTQYDVHIDFPRRQ